MSIYSEHIGKAGQETLLGPTAAGQRCRSEMWQLLKMSLTRALAVCLLCQDDANAEGLLYKAK